MRALLLILFFVLSASSSAEQRHPNSEHQLQLISTEEPSCQNKHPKLLNFFSWVDYTVLGTMLVVSCMIGTFYACFSKKQETSEDFLLGGSDMGTIPMAMSLAASFITAIELLGNPAEMYEHVSLGFSIFEFFMDLWLLIIIKIREQHQVTIDKSTDRNPNMLIEIP